MICNHFKLNIDISRNKIYDGIFDFINTNSSHSIKTPTSQHYTSYQNITRPRYHFCQKHTTTCPRTYPKTTRQSREKSQRSRETALYDRAHSTTRQNAGGARNASQYSSLSRKITAQRVLCSEKSRRRHFQSEERDTEAARAAVYRREQDALSFMGPINRAPIFIFRDVILIPAARGPPPGVHAAAAMSLRDAGFSSGAIFLMASGESLFTGLRAFVPTGSGFWRADK